MSAVTVFVTPWAARPNSPDAVAVDQEALPQADHRAPDPRDLGSAAKAPDGDLPPVAERRRALAGVADVAAVSAAAVAADRHSSGGTQHRLLRRDVAVTIRAAEHAVVAHPAVNVLARRVEPARPRLTLRHLLPGAGDEACPVPVPCARLRSAGRVAWAVCRSPDWHCLAKVRADGDKCAHEASLESGRNKLPCASREPEGRPAVVRQAYCPPENRDHRL